MFISNITLFFIAAFTIVVPIVFFFIARKNRIAHFSSKNKLKEFSEFFSKLFDDGSSAVAVVRLADCTLVNANNQYLQLFGFSEKEQIVGKPADDLRMLIEADSINRDTNTGHYEEFKKINFLSKTAESKWATVSRKAITLDGIQCLVIILNDITGIKNAQEEISRLSNLNRITSSQLEEANHANQETELFIHTVFHNLRDSLLVIDGYADGLLEQFVEVDDDHEGEEKINALEVITYNAQRMSLVIDNLLNLSRLTRKEMVLKAVNMNEMVGQIVKDQLAIYVDHQSEIKVGYLPTIKCDMILMRHVWVNLVSNALKFSSTRVKSYIEIGCSRQKDNHFVFYVKDNGVGFDNNYAGQLFKTFARLHKFKEFEGTGVGLVIVHRAVKRHGGKVWAEAKLNEGATFNFTVPAINEVYEGKFGYSAF